MSVQLGKSDTDLLLDIGNTALKWQYNGRAVIAVHPTNERVDVSTLDVIKKRPERVLVASVAGSQRIMQLAAYCWARWQLTLWVAKTRPEAAGIKCAYADSTRLGVDRWLAVLAAGSTPTLVADCGTAVTLDWVADGQHHGGWIVPGVRLMQQSLLGRTAQIFDIGEADYGLTVADDTAPAVAGGAWQAVAGLLERAARQVQAKSGQPLRLLICGGDGERLLPWLMPPVGVEPWELRGDLVLQGLTVLAEAHSPGSEGGHWQQPEVR